MTPEQIDSIFRNMGADIGNGRLQIDAFSAFALWEIARQLAVMNTRLLKDNE